MRRGRHEIPIIQQFDVASDPMMRSYAIGEPNELGVSSDAVARFYQINWPRRIALGDSDFYEWQFRHPPENQGQDCCCVAVDPDGTILGVMGLNRRSFLLNGKALMGAELTTWIVAADARHKRVGGRIMKFLQGNYELLMGMGITEEALSPYVRSGFRYMQHIPRFVRAYDLEAIKPYTQTTVLGQRLARSRSRRPPGRFHASEVPAGDLAAMAKEFSSQCNMFIRNEVALSWRFDQHPSFRYRAFNVRGNGSGIGVVIRVDNIENLRIAHVVDCFGDTRDTPAALDFIDDFCRQNDIHVADFYCTGSFIFRYFMAAGWFSILDDYFFQFIHLFHPPEFRTPPTTSLVYWCRNEMAELMDTGRLYVTKADMDLDRPTMAFLERHAPRKMPDRRTDR